AAGTRQPDTSAVRPGGRAPSPQAGGKPPDPRRLPGASGQVSSRCSATSGLLRFLNGASFRRAVINGGEDYWVGLTPPVPFEAALGVSMGGFGVRVVTDVGRRPADQRVRLA
ncbi:hypothetical protein ACWGE0_39495, partial [Lentzea sp. NPDC054927]